MSPPRGLRRGLRPANQRDHRVEVVQGDRETLEEMRARLGLLELELRAPLHHLAPERDEVFHQLQQRQHARPAADDRQHDDPERRLQRGVLVEVVEHHLRDLASLQLHHDPHAVTVGLVAEVADAVERLLPSELGDLLGPALPC